MSEGVSCDHWNRVWSETDYWRETDMQLGTSVDASLHVVCCRESTLACEICRRGTRRWILSKTRWLSDRWLRPEQVSALASCVLFNH
jgi:hypothetical protein